MHVNRIATVFVNGVKAGVLTEYRASQDLSARESYTFEYAADYLVDGAPIGHHLPLAKAQYEFDSLPPFFTNLLSEGWLRTHQAQKARLDKSDEFGLLCANGEELIGAVSVVAGEVETLPRQRFVQLPIPKPSTLKDKGITIVGTSRSFNDYAVDHANGHSISGVQRKLMMKLEGQQLVPTTRGGQYIVKPAPEGVPHCPENEFFVMSLANKIGLKTAECGLVPFEDGELAYVTKRFDILSKDERYFVEDGASLCLVHPKHKDSDALSYETVLKRLSETSGNSKAVTLNLFLQVVFSYLVANNDLHLKNFSLMRKPSGQDATMVNLTPIYDVLSLAPYPNFDRACFMSIGVLATEEGDEGYFSDAYEQFGFYTQSDFVQFGVNIGLPQALVEKQLKQLMGKLLKVIESGFRTPLPDQMYATITDRIRERCRAVELPYDEA
ncbi:type II toxin-antitoxin system HipA family toxin [Pseudidiomarina donghaiensis]|uniref:Type II toxin-antitoxin system HipA family toxin n=1 Tax=Pseudidiomarina donghaiensis TaxID=519452 RepID=A0A432XH40_9GAMM|nr:HipA domain-containing protein [Pseudidiomarina donghaiensis]RUO48035.1 type II toxin-antitoxin system HipA family toxin [Pseudidiomarina donghaiensis]SFV22821.1 serine/threonine-protein kinase HipA [Pseudidiomarina donghaiensis]